MSDQFIYLVTHNDHEDHSIHGVFLDPEMAKKHQQLLTSIEKYGGYGEFLVEAHPIITEQPKQIFAYYANIETGECYQVLEDYTTICGFDMDGKNTLQGHSVVGVGLTLEEAKQKALAYREEILAKQKS